MLNTHLVWAYHGPVLSQYRHVKIGGSFVALWYIVEGRVTLSWDRGELKVQRGQWVLSPSGDIYQRFSSDAEIWSVRFVINTSANQCLIDQQAPVLLSRPPAEMVASCQRLIELVQSRYGVRGMELLESECTLVDYMEMETAYQTFVRELLIVLGQHGVPLRPLGQMDPRLQHCIWQVHNSPLSRQYTESRLAEIAGVSVSQLNRLFQEQFGHTSRVWLDNYRYLEAQRLLDSHRPIKEVSYALGFSSPQHFASWFRKQSGMTPSVWRQRAEE